MTSLLQASAPQPPGPDTHLLVASQIQSLPKDLLSVSIFTLKTGSHTAVPKGPQPPEAQGAAGAMEASDTKPCTLALPLSCRKKTDLSTFHNQHVTWDAIHEEEHECWLRPQPRSVAAERPPALCVRESGPGRDCHSEPPGGCGSLIFRPGGSQTPALP